jgi:serine/threonine-protein kinase
MTESGMIVGTICYVPPEQLSHSEIFLSSDVYSLGVIFYELLTREKPFIGDTTLDIMNQILAKTPLEPYTFNQCIHPDLNKLISKMIAKSPDQRPHLKKIKETLSKVLASL